MRQVNLSFPDNSPHPAPLLMSPSAWIFSDQAHANVIYSFASFKTWNFLVNKLKIDPKKSAITVQVNVITL